MVKAGRDIARSDGEKGSSRWQGELIKGGRWVKVLIEGYDMPVKLKAVHFYPFDDHDIARAQSAVR
jgi:hypothetical protein